MANGIKIKRSFGPDKKMVTMHYLLIINWLIFLVSFVILFLSLTPGAGTYFQSRGVRIGSGGNSALVPIALLLLVILFVFSVAGIYINLQRRSRKGDVFHYSFIFHIAFALLVILAYLFTM